MANNTTNASNMNASILSHNSQNAKPNISNGSPVNIKSTVTTMKPPTSVINPQYQSQSQNFQVSKGQSTKRGASYRLASVDSVIDDENDDDLACIVVDNMENMQHFQENKRPTLLFNNPSTNICKSSLVETKPHISNNTASTFVSPVNTSNNQIIMPNVAIKTEPSSNPKQIFQNTTNILKNNPVMTSVRIGNVGEQTNVKSNLTPVNTTVFNKPADISAKLTFDNKFKRNCTLNTKKPINSAMVRELF
jgi:hypothetical protein